MDIINLMLNDKQITDVYDSIDSIKPFVSSHGMKHIKNLVDMIDETADIFELSDRELLMLKTCAIFHDIGRGENGLNHGESSRLFAENYLKDKNYFSSDELSLILDMIEWHDELFDFSKLKTKLHWIINMLDKFDFSKNRVQENYRKYFDYSFSEDIEKIEFSSDGKILKVVLRLIENPLAISQQALLSRNLTCKAIIVFEKYCEKFGLIPKLFIEDEEVDISKCSHDVIMR